MKVEVYIGGYWHVLFLLYLLPLSSLFWGWSSFPHWGEVGFIYLLDWTELQTYNWLSWSFLEGSSAALFFGASINHGGSSWRIFQGYNTNRCRFVMVSSHWGFPTKSFSIQDATSCWLGSDTSKHILVAENFRERRGLVMLFVWFSSRLAACPIRTNAYTNIIPFPPPPQPKKETNSCFAENKCNGIEGKGWKGKNLHGNDHRWNSYCL